MSNAVNFQIWCYFVCGIPCTMYKATIFPENLTKANAPHSMFFLLIFNNTIIMRDYLCLCALQGCPFCFLCYNYSDSLVNLLNVIDSNPEQSSSNLSLTIVKVDGTVDGKNNKEKKTREVSDNRMYHFI